jgi:hypothetical protein
MISITKLTVVAPIRRIIFIERKKDEQCRKATVFIIQTLEIQTLWQN